MLYHHFVINCNNIYNFIHFIIYTFKEIVVKKNKKSKNVPKKEYGRWVLSHTFNDTWASVEPSLKHFYT